MQSEDAERPFLAADNPLEEGTAPLPGTLRTKNSRDRREHLEQFLRFAIETKAYRTGDRVPTERALSARFAVPRGVVRGVLARLTREGLLFRRNGSGTFVGEVPSSTETATSVVGPSDILEARLAVEVGYLDLVVARASDADFQRIEAQLKLMEEAVDQPSFRMAGYGFHLRVAEASRNPIIVAMQSQIMSAREAVGWSTIKGLNETPALRRAQSERLRELLNALRARDAKRATAIAAEELDRFVQSIIR